MDEIMSCVCCNQCFETIAKQDTGAAKLWLDICSYFVKFSGNFSLNETMIPTALPHFQALESMGYISTCDGEKSVVVRVNGFEVLQGQTDASSFNTFCLERGRHNQVWL